jgi:hypothetical protein
MNRALITSVDMARYERILETINGYLENNEPSYNTDTTSCIQYKELFSYYFRSLVLVGEQERNSGSSIDHEQGIL